MKHSKNKIAIITLNYNEPLSTIACINSFSKLAAKYDLNYYIVNNGSTDNSLELITKSLPSANIIKSKTNLGFAGGNNLGIRQALKDDCTHLLLINNDAEVISANFFDLLLDSPYNISSACIVSSDPKIDLVDYGGVVDWYFGKNIHRHNQGRVDYVSGACLFAKSSLFKKVGKLDPRFFLYYEDVDYCLRAKKLGLTVGIIPKLKIKHTLSLSTNKLGKKKIKILAQSHLRFCLKHLTPVAFPLYFGFNLYLRLKAFLPAKA